MDVLLNLGIDWWSVLLYAGNILLVVLVLTYLLYGPLVKVLDQRRKQIQDSIDESAKLQDSFEKKLKELEKEKEAAEAELREELVKLRSFVKQEKAQLASEMEEARVKMMEKAQKEINAKQEALIKDAEKEIMALMTRIILDIVENQVPEDVIQKSIQSAWKQYQ